MTYTKIDEKNIFSAFALVFMLVFSTFVGVARADFDMTSNYSDLGGGGYDITSNYSDLGNSGYDLTSNYSDLTSNYSDLASNYSDLGAVTSPRFDPNGVAVDPYGVAVDPQGVSVATTPNAYDIYNIYGGYPYNVYGGCGFGCGGFGGFGSSFNLGLFYSNVGTPSFVNPVVYSTPIVYSTPVVSQPVTYVAPVTYATPQYNVQSYVPSYNYNYQAPSCSITTSNSNLNYNYYNYTNNNYYTGQTLLTWYSNGANSAYISPSVGSVSTSGSTTVFSPGGQTYTLTVSGPGGVATCQTTAYSNTYAYNYTAPQVYSNYVAPTPPVYQAPTTPYVALTQIPYTGLDLGPVGNVLYWLALALFAIAGGYLVVYYRGGGLAPLNDFLGADGPVPVRNAPRAEQVIEKAKPVAPGTTPRVVLGMNSRAPFGTKDVMTTVKPTNGDAPRIVIVRE